MDDIDLGERRLAGGEHPKSAMYPNLCHYRVQLMGCLFHGVVDCIVDCGHDGGLGKQAWGLTSVEWLLSIVRSGMMCRV